METLAKLPLVIERNFPLVTVTTDGQEMLMVVDTGAEETLVTPQAARIMGLARDPKRATLLLGAGGTARGRNVILGDLRLGDEAVGDRSVGVHGIGDFAVPGHLVGGLLGADVLSRYDVEIDAPHRRMALYATKGCAGLTPWAETSIRVPLKPTASGLLFLPASIDGHPVRAMLDTGARTSVVKREAANAVGVTDGMLSAAPSTTGQGVDLRALQFHPYRFASVDLGSIDMHNVTLNVTDMKLPNVEMLLGDDWIASRRIWISYVNSTLFVDTSEFDARSASTGFVDVESGP